MKFRKVIKASALTLAVQSALMVTSALPQQALADDQADELYGLKHPSNSVEFGALYASQSSSRFGQYNGLNKEGFYGIGGFDLRGGPGYDGNDSALRWWLGASNLGTTSRSFDSKISEQGKWSISIGYDELRHSITNTFQTPLLGNPGDNQFNLPTNFGSINAASAQGGTRGITQSPTQLNALHTQQEYTTRQNIPVTAQYFITPELSANIDYKHTEQSGAKLLGTGSQAGINLVGGSSGRSEAVNIILNPTSYTTDNINAALNWVGDKAHLSGGYYASLFHDNYNSVSWQNAVATGSSNCRGTGCFVNNTMSTAPSNTLHQINLNGGYDFTPKTKLAGGFSWGYNTQNDPFAPTNIMQPSSIPFNMMPKGLPATSLNGQVETIHADMKLTDQSIKDLTLTAGFKFNERDNQTSSNIYNYQTIGNAAYTGINMPYSNRKSQYEASAAYRLTKNQTLRLGYERESIDRWCNSVVGSLGCVSTPSTNEDKINLTYRLKAFDNVNFNAGYTYGNRRASYDPNFMFSSYAANTPKTALNGYNFLGFVAYPYASRNENMGKAGVTWQVTQQLDVGLNGTYTYDNYDATLGVQDRRAASVNFDATYNYAENNSISAYYNWQNGFRNLRSGNNGTITKASTNIWTNQLDDTSNGFGLLSRHTGLMGGNLEIIGDVSYALDTSSYVTQVNYNPTCGSSTTLTCGNLSPIKNELLSLKLTGNYKVHKNGKVSLSYMYQQLISNDYFYNAQQVGYTYNTMMPTGLQPQSYAVNVVGLSYMYNF